MSGIHIEEAEIPGKYAEVFFLKTSKSFGFGDQMAHEWMGKGRKEKWRKDKTLKVKMSKTKI